MKAERFEDLVAWQKARGLARDVHRLTRAPAFREDLDLVRQLRRASLSAVTNIAEGFERRTPADFAHFLNMAGASSGEVRSLMYTVEDCGFASPTVAASFRERAAEVSRIVHAFRVAVLKKANEDKSKATAKRNAV